MSFFSIYFHSICAIGRYHKIDGIPKPDNIIKLGPDAYWVSIEGGNSQAKRRAFKKANEYCVRLGKELLVSNFSQRYNPEGISDYIAEVIFQCLHKDDPRLVRPVYKNDK